MAAVDQGSTGGPPAGAVSWAGPPTSWELTVLHKVPAPHRPSCSGTMKEAGAASTGNYSMDHVSCLETVEGLNEKKN